MGRGKKLERTLWTGLAVATFAAGIAAGPKIGNTVKKFGKWFEKPDVERIEKAIKAEKPKIPEKEKPTKKNVQTTVETAEETEFEEIKKTNDELVESVPAIYKDEARQLLGYLDEKNVNEQGKENFINLFKLLIDGLNEDHARKELEIFGEMIKNMDNGPLNIGVIKNYTTMIDKIVDITEEGGYVHFHAVMNLYALEKIAQKGNLNAKTISVIIKTIDNSDDKDYGYGCITRFLESTDSNINFLNDDFGLKFAQTANKALEDKEGMLQTIFKLSMGNPELDQYLINEYYLEGMKTTLSYIRKNAKHKNENKLQKVYINIVSGRGSENFGVSDIITGEKMAETLGFNDFEISINLGFAINAVGEEKTKKLHEEYGIIYFGRYDKKLLEETYNAIDPEYKKEMPVLLAVYTKEDWNGAFYNDRDKHEDLEKAYKMIIYETDTDYGFRNAISNTFKRHGDIDVLVVGGHGHPNKIALGSGNKETNILDLSDKDELAYLRYMFTANPKIILQSCSTGKKVDGIGAVLSDVFDATLWAPVDPAGMQRIVLDGNSLLEDIQYLDSDCRKFVNGKIVDTNKSFLNRNK